MSRPQSRARMGYFPLAGAGAHRIRQHLIYPSSSFAALDPCAGEGKALAVWSISQGGSNVGDCTCAVAAQHNDAAITIRERVRSGS